MKTSRGFWVFEFAVWQKTKTWNSQKPTESFLDKKTSIVNGYYYQKTAKKLPIWYLSTILASKTTKTTFKFDCQAYVDNYEQYLESCALDAENSQKSAINDINSFNN